MAQIRIQNGNYRGQPVTGVFDLVKEWKQGAKGGFVTVVNEGSFDGGDTVRVKVAKGDFEVMGEMTATYHAPGGETSKARMTTAELKETDDETIVRIEKTFSFIETLASAAQKGQIRAAIISGPAGVGKSFGVERTLDKLNFQRTCAGKLPNYESVTGAASALGLYKALWRNRNKGMALVFDDCDSMLWDESMLNMLKGAMDTKKHRYICWLTESRVLENEGIPDRFEFEGSIIFLTNLKFDQCRSKKIAAHLEAIMSRVHYLDLCLDSRREQLLRVKQVVKAGMLDDRDLTDEVKEQVVSYVYDNVDYLQELSLRTVLKVADLAQLNRFNWSESADFTVLSHEGRIRKTLAQRAQA